MKISLYVPQGTQGMTDFIQHEQKTAGNIKDRNTRQSVVGGLAKISYSL